MIQALAITGPTASGKTALAIGIGIVVAVPVGVLLYFTAGSEKTAAYMQALKEDGCYTVDPEILAEIRKNFSGYYTNEEDTAKTIHDTFQKYGYLADTHTAVAIHAAESYVADTGDMRPMVIDSTASPYKFANNVYRAVSGKEAVSELQALDDLAAATNTEIPYPLAGLATRKVRFEKVVDREDMARSVLKYIEA